VKYLKLGSVTAFAIFIFIGFCWEGQSEVPAISRAYIEAAQNEFKAQNILTPILLTWRGFDTFGEIIVLFLATTAIAFLNRQEGVRRKRALPSYLGSTKVTISGVSILQPLLFVFAVYIFSFGHISPGGAFQGGVIFGSGFVLWVLVHPDEDFRYSVLSAIETLSGVTYLVLASLGLLILGTFLDPGYLPFGQMGSLISTAAIPLMYIALGIKVGVEMIKIVSKFRD
jgi:multicomponent Na+:H+ antiporter subunit B